MKQVTLDSQIINGSVRLGRGNIISSKDIADNPGDYPIYSSSAQGSGEFGRYGEYMFDEELVTWSIDGGGRFFFRPKHKFSVTNVSGYIKSDDEIWDRKFLYYSLDFQHSRLAFDYQAKAHPSVIRHLFSFTAFPRDEQTKIGKILGALDLAIEQTETLIAKQQRIKTGLMQDLLTKGIDEHGNIRSEATHAFKDSPLGRIPVEWDVLEIKSLLADVDPAMRSGPFGSALLKEELTESGIPLLGIDNVFPEKFVADYKRFVPPKKAEQLRRYLVRPCDLMITIMGTVGRCCVVPDSIGDALSSKHVWTITINQAKYSPYVACLQINHSPWVLEHFTKDEQGGIMASIRAETLRTTKLPVPPQDELEKIERILREISADLVEKEALATKLCSLRIGLMHDLLTGKRRVTPLLEAETDKPDV